MSDAMAATECIDELKDTGMDYAQARALVRFMVRSQEHLATKDDFKALEVKFQALEVKFQTLEVKFQTLEVKIKVLEASLTRQLYLFGFGIIGSLIAIMGLFLALQTQMLVPG